MGDVIAQVFYYISGDNLLVDATVFFLQPNLKKKKKRDRCIERIFSPKCLSIPFLKLTNYFTCAYSPSRGFGRNRTFKRKPFPQLP